MTSGRAYLSFNVSTVNDIEEAPEYYARFSRREESKVMIRIQVRSTRIMSTLPSPGIDRVYFYISRRACTNENEWFLRPLALSFDTIWTPPVLLALARPILPGGRRIFARAETCTIKLSGQADVSSPSALPRVGAVD
jgi:hypothetical protein